MPRSLAPEPVSPLDPVDRLPGLGPSSRAALGEHGIRTVVDLVWTAPSGWDDLRAPLSLAEAVRQAAAADGGRRVAFAAVVEKAAVVPIRGRRTVRVVVHDRNDTTCKLHAFWFFLAQGVLALAKPGAELLFVGRVVALPKKPARVAHPDVFADAPEARTVRARYPRLGPSGAAVKRAIAHALEAVVLRTPAPAIDPVPPAIAKRESMPDAVDVLRRVHSAAGELPKGDDTRAFLERLAWAEAFTRAWDRLLVDEAAEGAEGTPLPPLPDGIARLEEVLGFTLTTSQREACSEVSAALGRPEPMRRLLLGDVGSGKTAVALHAIAQCAAAGKQAAILAPTSVLAEQTKDALQPLEALGVRPAFVAGGIPASDRRRAEAALASGDANVAVGTHALLGEDVVIPKLALVIVDEQQRLGVGQRLSLVRKGSDAVRRNRPHLLTLSATPIPRTLALALRGELATSVLRERPRGRPPVTTTLADSDELDPVIRRIAATIERSERVFWIVPRVDEADDDDDDDDASAKARTAALRSLFGSGAVASIHGRMPPSDKRAVMHAFRAGTVPVLVATTVIEVGVDVPEATLMIVEDAARFGLAQLHQLRGRVGRGDRPGTCVLLRPGDLEGPAKARLEAMTTLTTGEEIAHADLLLRGAGDLGGTRQHGDEALVYLDPAADYAWLARVESDAREIHAHDPGLTRPEHVVLGALVRRLSEALAIRTEAG